ncbi:MAG: NAD(P)-binding domain-containing protein, partial [Rhodobacteraceae bacterium]|nr:NAD(P)-binding domain-containing protein [Paracoccaceae bacterium]
MARVCIYGAGAIGGYLGAKLAGTDADVSLVARGPHLAAIKANGLTLIEDGQTSTHKITATDDPATLGVQDFVIVTLKAHSIPAVVDQMQPLLGPDTAVVFAVNG